MKKIVLILFMFFSLFGFSQQDVFNRSDSNTGDFGSGNLPWFYQTSNNNQGDPDNGNTVSNNVKIGHNNFTTMITNGRFYRVRTLEFQAAATANRTINNSGGGLGVSFGIYNNSSGSHTFNTPIGIDGATVQLQANSGPFIFTTDIFMNANTLEFGGSNNSFVSGVLQGTGKLVKNGTGFLTLSSTSTYSGNTELDNGELWIETTGDAIANNNIFLGNGGLSGNTTKIFLSRAAGGTTFSRNINVNPGSPNTRFIGSLNTSGTNTFSGNIIRTSNQPLNVEVLNSGGSLNISGVINGTAAITKVGAGELILSGTNSYSGGTVISAGVVSASTTANLGATGGAITLGNGVTIGTLNITSTLARTALRVTDASTAGVINVATGQTFTLTTLNMVSGTNNATKIGKSGPGTLTLSAAGTYTGQTQIGDGTVIVSNNAGLGTNNTTSARGIDLGLNVGDVSQANNVSVLATTGITVPQSIYVAPNTSSATRTIGLSGVLGTATFSNEIFLDGSLTTTGTGTVVLSGRLTNTGNLITTATITTLSNSANNFSGTTTIQSGSELRLNPSANAAYASQIVLNGGTLATTSITTNRTFTSSSTLLLNASSTITLGTNAHTVTFANSSGVTWTGATTLTITGWTGTPGVAGTASAGRIFIGAANTTLTTTQLDQITFQGYEPGAVLKSTGELMPKGYITYYSKGSLAPEVLTNWSLTIDGTGASPANFTSTAVFVIQNGHTMTTGAAWTLSGASTTLQILNGGTLVSTFAVTMPVTGTFQIDNGGLYKHDNASAWATTIFTGTEVFGNSSTVEINETAATLPQNSTYGNLTFDLNTPTTPAGSVNFAGNLTTINGNFIVRNTQGFELRLANTGTTLDIVGNLEVHPNAIFTLKAGTNAANQTINVDGNVSLIGGTFYLNGPNSTSGGSAFLVTRGASFTISENVTFTGGNLVGASGFYFNRNVEQTLNVAHPFSSGGIRNRFFVSTANSIAINEVYNGVAAQTTIDGTGVTPGAGWAAWPTASTALKSFTINNSTGVTLSTNRVVNTTLGLTNGTITPGANSLTLAPTATFTGGSATSHVNGVLNRVYTTTGSAVFPVGKAGVYRPVGFEYTALTGTSTVSVNQIETALTGTLPADTNLNNARTWDISQTGGSAFTYNVTLDPTGDTTTGTVVMLKRESGTTSSNATTTPNFTNATGFTTLTGTNNFTLGSACTVTSNAGANQTDCIGTVFTLAANAPSFGTGAWTVSGPSTNASQFSNTASATSTFTADGGAGTYTLTWTITNGSCTANSNLTITVNPSIPASVSASASPSGAICAGTNVTFTATPTNGGTSPTYQWLVNGSPVSGETNVTFTSTTLANNNVVTVEMTSNASPCLSGSPPTSTGITITVNPLLTASVSASASPSGAICAGTSVTFTANATNGGTTPSYQWLVNGSPVSGEIASTFTSTTLANGDLITVEMTSNASPCLTGPPATSTGITMTVNSLPTASISGNNGPVICSGNDITFTLAGTSGAALTYNLNGGASVTTTLTGGTATVTVTGATASQILNLVSVTDGTCAATLSGSSTVTVGATTTWIVTSPANSPAWNNGTPTNSMTAVISANYSEATTLNACALTVNSGAVVSIPSGTNIVLNGALTVASGSTFTLNNNANLVQNIDVNNSGNIIVRRQSNPLIRLDYTLWSSPVTGQGLYAFSPFTFANRFYNYNSTTNLYSNSALGMNVTGTNASGVNGTDNNNVQFEAGKGYLIRLPFNHPTAPAVWTGNFTGVPNNGDRSVTLNNVGAGQRFNLIGNPYPSTLSMTQFVNDNSSNITGTLYFWRKTNSTTTSPGYCTWAGGTFVSNGEAQVFNPQGVIQIGQGFIVEATASGASVNFNNGQRIANNVNQFFRANSANQLTAATTSVEYNRLWLNMTSTTNEFYQMSVGYNSGATQEVDSFDGKYFNDGPISLNSIINNEYYVIQGRALPFVASDQVPLSYKVTNAGSYTIAIDHADGLFASGTQEVYLRDNLNNTQTNLNTSSYSFASEAGTFNDRFVLVYENQLSVVNPTFTSDNVVVYKNSEDFEVNSGAATMSEITVFDIRGRLIQSKSNINATETRLNVGTTNQVLLFQIKTTDGILVTKKVVN